MSIFLEYDELNKWLLEAGQVPINEVYIGKTKDILRAEELLGVFREKYMGKYYLNTRVNSDKELLKFNRLIEDVFGFGCFTLQIHNVPQANAFTMPIDYRHDYLINEVITDENGFRFIKDADYSCICGIYSGVIFNPEYTDSEVFALILHEIGHNFNSAINEPAGVMMRMYSTMAYALNLYTAYLGNIPGAIELVRNSNQWRTPVDKAIRNMREKGKLPIILIDVLNQINDLKNSGLMVIDALLRIGSLGSLTLLSALTSVMRALNPVNSILIFSRVKTMTSSELSADNFATIYGYGPELSSALNKISTSSKANPNFIIKTFDKVPVVSQLMHTIEIPAYMFASIFDEHPQEIHRVKDQIRLLQREIEKEDLDPKMKKVIQSDMRECEKVADSLIDVSSNTKDPYIGKYIYNKMIKDIEVKSKVFGGKAAKHKFDEYDKAYKKYYK